MAGTKLKYKPGIVMGGRHILHDCGVSRSIGYFLEPLILLGLFAKKPLTIRLKGTISLGPLDCSVFLFRLTCYCCWSSDSALRCCLIRM